MRARKRRPDDPESSGMKNLNIRALTELSVEEQKGCRIEIAYIDPEAYAAIVNHPLRKDVLRTLYRMALSGPVSKQEMADKLGIDYHQLVYQLNHHLREFWRVEREEKVRGTRMELIAPSHPYTIYIALGRGRTINVFDPLANLFGSLSHVGTRCDSCSTADSTKCMGYVEGGCSCSSNPSPEEKEVLKLNGRSAPYRPLDNAILCALRGIPAGKDCVVDIPCEGCAFLKKTIQIT